MDNFIKKITQDTYKSYLTRFSIELGQSQTSINQNGAEVIYWETENFKFSLIKTIPIDYYYQIESFCDKSPLEFQHELRVKPDF